MKCSGEKYEVGHRKYKLYGLSIGELLVSSFEGLLGWIEQIRDVYDCTSIAFSINQIEAFALKAIELNLV